MNLEDKKIAILSITNNGRELALKIKEIMKNVDAMMSEWQTIVSFTFSINGFPYNTGVPFICCKGN